MLIAPLVGFAVARIFAKVAVRFSGLFGHRADRSFKNMQAVSLAAQTFSCGANEAQKAMGVIAFTLVIVGINVLRAGDSVVIPWWVIALCSLGIAAGVMAGGWRAIKAVGVRSRKVKPTRAFAPQMASAFVIYTFTIFGYPLSTAQVISSSTAEADVASRFKAVCWRLVKDSGFVCFVNIIASGVLAALCFIIFKLLFNIS